MVDRLTPERLNEIRAQIESALDLGLQAWRTTKARDHFIAAHDNVDDLVAELARVQAELADANERAGRAAHLAENLHGMVSRETWRATGGDDGQGHYEGDYHAEQIADEIKRLRAAVSTKEPDRRWRWSDVCPACKGYPGQEHTGTACGLDSEHDASTASSEGS